MDNKMKFFSSVVALPVSMLTFSLLLAVSPINTAETGYRSLILLAVAFLVLGVLAMKISYTFFRKLSEESREKEHLLAERKKLIDTQRTWIENLEDDILSMQVKVTEAEKKQAMIADPVFMASNTHRPAFVLDTEGKIGYVNEGFEKLTGYTLNTILGHQFEDVLTGPGTDSRDLEQIISGLETINTFSQEVLNYRNTGTSFNASITFHPVETSDGMMRLAFIEDVSDINEKNLKLKIFEQMADNLEEAVFVTDGEGAIEWVNRSFERVTEYTSEEVIGRKAESFLRSKFRKPESGADDYSLTEAVYNYTKSGRGYWSSLSISPVYNESGKIEKFIAIESEINVQEEKVQEVENRIQELWEDQYAKSVELEKREEELVEALELCNKIKNDVQDLWLMSDQLESAVIITDQSGRIEWVNEGFEKVFDCKFSEVAGKKPGFSNQKSSSVK